MKYSVGPGQETALKRSSLLIYVSVERLLATFLRLFLLNFLVYLNSCFSPFCKIIQKLEKKVNRPTERKPLQTGALDLILILDS